jgi:hypothetical protein
VGSGTKRKQAFLRNHPVCFNCGVAPATTEDHVPSRQCFVGRQWPEGYVFPACGPCNTKLAKIEQAMALLIRLADQDESRIDKDELLRMINGVRNNTPDLLPREFTDSSKRREAIKAAKCVSKPGETEEDAPVVEMPPGWQRAVHGFSRKLTLALHYKEVGCPLPQAHWLRTSFFQFSDVAAPDIVSQFQRLLPQFRRGERRSTDLGDQFQYVFEHSADEGLFAVLAQLSRSWFILGVTAAPENHPDPSKYIKHADQLLLHV